MLMLIPIPIPILDLILSHKLLLRQCLGKNNLSTPQKQQQQLLLLLPRHPNTQLLLTRDPCLSEEAQDWIAMQMPHLLLHNHKRQTQLNHDHGEGLWKEMLEWCFPLQALISDKSAFFFFFFFLLLFVLDLFVNKIHLLVALKLETESTKRPNVEFTNLTFTEKRQEKKNNPQNQNKLAIEKETEKKNTVSMAMKHSDSTDE
eukprot:m.217117 g.217117  ORF g.217117 m.217117 type:complete len:202 (-) comp16986_c3_seq9:915-1520(-)